MSKIGRALISVSDKTGIAELAKELNQMGVEIISTGGTAKLLEHNNIPVTRVSDYTGFPEMLDGRVKTLNPLIHAGILAKRNNNDHIKQLEEHSIKQIDMIVVNLYPFEETIKREGCTFDEAIENIDIGGPTMIRSAAKNFGDVSVIVDPNDYADIISELKEKNGELSKKTNFRLAKKVFQHTARYDSMISNYLDQATVPELQTVEKPVFSDLLNLQLEKAMDLRYGENPHQQAAFYKEFNITEVCVANAQQLQGKELSFNNIIDLDAAWEITKEFKIPAAIVIKHTNPCGAATGPTLVEAYRKGRQTDPVSAFGSIIGLNRTVDAETAKELVSTFIEAVFAPAYDYEALQILKSKPNIRLLQPSSPDQLSKPSGFDMKKVVGGLLIQDRDLAKIDNISELEVVTNRKPTDKELQALDFGWKVVKHVKSNAIVYCTEDQLVGVGAGQMSRLDSSRIAILKANLSIEGTVLASDAFFPFRDGIDAAAKAGATAIIQPGGSVKDDEVIAAANEHNMTMVFTKIRHFKH